MRSAKDHENRILELEKKLSDMLERPTTVSHVCVCQTGG